MARNFFGSLNSMARAVDRLQRRAEAEQRRQKRAHLQHQQKIKKDQQIKDKKDKQYYQQMAKQQRLKDREEKQNYQQAQRDQRIRDKEEKQRRLELRLKEAEDRNAELIERLESLRTILAYALAVNNVIRFDSLRIGIQCEPVPIPQELTSGPRAPRKEDFISEVRAPGLLQKMLAEAFGFEKRYEKRYESKLAAATLKYEQALAAHEQSEKKREAKLAIFKTEIEQARQSFIAKAQQKNREVDEFEMAYRNGNYQAIVNYNKLVLERSKYPDGFPQKFHLGYSMESKQLVIDYDLPSIGIIPTEAEFKYVKSKDAIEAKPQKAAEMNNLYQDVVAAVALRTLHEVFDADQCSHVDVAVFNGFVHATDPSTGRPVHPCILSARVTKSIYSEIDLTRVEKRVCLRSLGAQVSNQPQALQAVKPIIEFNMVDKRFVEQGDVLSELDSRPNLMDLNPFEFETLVSNLFSKMGLDTKQTRTTKDGGVDAVAFDTRPVIGGKVVIQAKRYRYTVGVSAVRDLYGTMQHEGANKGILVTTSGYGPDAYEFSKDKPIELIDGGGLLYLLDQVGTKAKIILPEDGA